MIDRARGFVFVHIPKTAGTSLRIAAERAARLAVERAGTELLEPWSRVEIEVPEPSVGAVIAEDFVRPGAAVQFVVSGAAAQDVDEPRGGFRDRELFAGDWRHDDGLGSVLTQFPSDGECAFMR